jgi:hypothetical protein
MDFGIGNAIIIIGLVLAIIGITIVVIWLSTDLKSTAYDKIAKFSTLGYILIWVGGMSMFVGGGIIGTGNKETRTLREYNRLKVDIFKSQENLEMFLSKHPEIKIEE